MARACLFVVLSLVTRFALYGQTPTISTVTDIDGGPKVAPGGYALIFGSNLSTDTSVAPNTSAVVTIGGKKAYVYFESPTQLIVQIPVDAPVNTSISLIVGSSAPFSITPSEYAPALYAVNGSSIAALHANANTIVSSTAPAAPGEALIIYATGLGPTNPPAATGVAPTGASQTTTLPIVTVAGIQGTATFSELVSIGEYQVNFKVPANAPSGNDSISISIGGVTSSALILPVDLPVILSVENAGSYIPAGLPDAGIAQGAIFVVKGTSLGPSAISIASTPFQGTSQSGTSVSVTVGGQTVQGLMYYSSAGQVAALLPSNTPVGTGTITVTYNNLVSAAFPVTVVQNNLNIFTVTSDGTGEAIVTNADYSLVSPTRAVNCGGPYTTCGAANPGDTLILWATGLGPVSAPDQSGPQPGNMPSIPLKLYLGGVQAPVTYQGRSGCCIGEDQIVFTVPANVPTGCAVPLLAQIGTEISNSTVIPVANGTRACTPTNSVLTPSVEQALSAGLLAYGSIEIDRQVNSSGTGYSDIAQAKFAKVTVSTALQPFMISYADTEPAGTCLVYNSRSTSSTPPFATTVGINAGAQLSLSGPNGSQSMALTAGQVPTEYDATLSATGAYLSPGSYTVGGSGGADVGGFSQAFTIPTPPVWTNQSSLASVNRANGLTVTWSGGSANNMVLIEGESATDKSFTTEATFSCSVAATAGTFTVPPAVLLALPAGSNGVLYFKPTITPVGFTAGGLNLGFVNSSLATAIASVFQ